jgi:hypothetical protein
MNSITRSAQQNLWLPNRAAPCAAIGFTTLSPALRQYEKKRRKSLNEPDNYLSKDKDVSTDDQILITSIERLDKEL